MSSGNIRAARMRVRERSLTPALRAGNIEILKPSLFSFQSEVSRNWFPPPSLLESCAEITREEAGEVNRLPVQYRSSHIDQKQHTHTPEYCAGCMRVWLFSEEIFHPVNPGTLAH